MSKQIEQSAIFASPAKNSEHKQSTPQADQHYEQVVPEAFPQTGQQPGVPVKSSIASEWRGLVGAARLMWSKVSEAELLTSEGDEQKLTDIISARYVLSRNTANAQVKKFLATQVIDNRFPQPI